MGCHPWPEGCKPSLGVSKRHGYDRFPVKRQRLTGMVGSPSPKQRVNETLSSRSRSTLGVLTKLSLPPEPPMSARNVSTLMTTTL